MHSLTASKIKMSYWAKTVPKTHPCSPSYSQGEFGGFSYVELPNIMEEGTIWARNVGPNSKPKLYGQSARWVGGQSNPFEFLIG